MGRWRLGRSRLACVVAPLLAAALSGCCAAECASERLPSRGQPRTGEELFALVQHAARFECYEALYDALSQRTRDEHSYVKLRLGLPSVTVPEPYEYPLLDVMAQGTFLGVWPGPLGRELVMVEYQEPGRPLLLAQILVITERDPSAGGDLKKMALEEQVQEGPAFAQEAAPAGAGGGRK